MRELIELILKIGIDIGTSFYYEDVKSDSDPCTPSNVWKMVGYNFIMICETRIKLSNIKNYGCIVEGVYDRTKGRIRYVINNKKLYITTYQNDNFIFYKKDLGNNIEEILSALDNFFKDK